MTTKAKKKKNDKPYADTNNVKNNDNNKNNNYEDNLHLGYALGTLKDRRTRIRLCAMFKIYRAAVHMSVQITVHLTAESRPKSHSAECASSIMAVDIGHIRQHICLTWSQATKRNIQGGGFGPVLWIEFGVAQWSERLKWQNIAGGQREARSTTHEQHCRKCRKIRQIVHNDSHFHFKHERPQLWTENKWMLHDDNAPAHRVLITCQFCTRNEMVVVPQSRIRQIFLLRPIFVPKDEIEDKGSPRFGTVEEINTNHRMCLTGFKNVTSRRHSKVIRHIALSRLWNSLPASIRDCRNKIEFKRKLTRHLVTDDKSCWGLRRMADPHSGGGTIRASCGMNRWSSSSSSCTWWVLALISTREFA
ncbi:hypothetical protein ANN_06009 [Periplaneta americana]|uniref:Uncharacterized protein n=1 Tax=Periplaneta americana TaxID=6978 RepID=A0ABQ8TDA5_PERAM|nr:hypothetical protein ANN_06009 [Periplaneta americana]